MFDEDAWVAYPQHHNWFNKLYVAEQLKYMCGPCGVAPSVSGYYIVRPIYNLGGMGVGTSLQYIESGDNSKVPPGYFWCEVLLGKQYSATYEFMHGGIHDAKPYWKPISCWEADLAPNSYTKYVMWRRSTYFPEVPRVFNVLSDVKRINVEFKGNCPFEVHLRDTPDPDYDVLVPIWKDTSIADIEWYLKQGYTYVSDPDDSNGFLELPREGFMVK